MAHQARIEIPGSVAQYVRPDVPYETRMLAAGGMPGLSPREQLLLLFCLTKDGDTVVRGCATKTMIELDRNVLLQALSEELHPAVFHSVALVCGDDPKVRDGLLQLPELAGATRALLQSYAAVFKNENVADQGNKASPQETETTPEDSVPESGAEEDVSDIDEESEEYLSKYKLVQTMDIGEKIKMALTGDKEWRKILVKDTNKLVCSGVIKNPRMTEPEVLTVLKSGSQNDEVIRLICANKEWVKNYQIRKALIENPKTPLSQALRYLATMNEKDIASYAKSRNISSVISTQAKRIILNKKH